MQTAFPTSEEAGKFLERLVSLFNACVRRHDFSEYVNVFEDDAVVDYEGVPGRGPLEGKPAIAEHFREDPPDDEVLVTRWRYESGRITAQFVWKDIPEACGGALTIVPHDQKIAKLTLAFGGPAVKWRGRS